jgi:hypothetical protein
MSVPSRIEEYVMHLDGMERCPECGFVWNDTGEGHYHDCRYYVLEDQEDLLADEIVVAFELSPPVRAYRSRRRNTRVSV